MAKHLDSWMRRIPQNAKTPLLFAWHLTATVMAVLYALDRLLWMRLFLRQRGFGSTREHSVGRGDRSTGKGLHHPKVEYRCSFCGKRQEQVRRIIAGPGGVYICDECVELCQEIIAEEKGPVI